MEISTVIRNLKDYCRGVWNNKVIDEQTTRDQILYGDPMNFEVGLFGDYSIRIDESVKAVERMYAILGDVFVGGNLIVDKGFVVGSIGEG